MRKTVSYLNQLKRDVEDSLEAVTTAGVDVDTAAYDLSGITPHDLVTNDTDVKDLYDACLVSIKELKKQLDSFKQARDKYTEFF